MFMGQIGSLSRGPEKPVLSGAKHRNPLWFPNAFASLTDVPDMARGADGNTIGLSKGHRDH